MAALQRRGEMRRKNERREKKDGGCPDQKVKWLKRKGAWEREGGREEREGREGGKEGGRERGRRREAITSRCEPLKVSLPLMKCCLTTSYLLERLKKTHHSQHIR